MEAPVFASLALRTVPHCVRPRARHISYPCTTMSGSGYHHHKDVLAKKIRSLLCSLSPSTYDKTAPKIECWIEYVITEQFMTVKDLAERVSSLAWYFYPENARSIVPRFLKESRDAPYRSEQMRFFVDELCHHVLRWFAVASADRLRMSQGYHGSIPEGGAIGFVRAASFVGHLIEYGLLSRELVRRHLKPLTHYDLDLTNGVDPVVMASVIYQLLTTAGNTMLRGLLEPGDVQVFFGILDAQTSSSSSGIVGLDSVRLGAVNLDVRCGSYLNTSH